MTDPYAEPRSGRGQTSRSRAIRASQIAYEEFRARGLRYSVRDRTSFHFRFDAGRALQGAIAIYVYGVLRRLRDVGLCGGKMQVANERGLKKFRRLVQDGFVPTPREIRDRLRGMQLQGKLRAKPEVIEQLARMIDDWPRLKRVVYEMGKTHGLTQHPKS